MAMTMFSSGVLRGLRLALEHEPPYSPADLHKVEILIVPNDGEPRGIEHLPNLYSVTFRGCELVDLSVLAACPGLRSVAAWSSNLTTLAPLPSAVPDVYEVDIRVGRVQDLSPLLHLPNLREVRLAGNPLDEPSFREIQPELLRRGCIDPELEGSTVEAREWELMQEFLALGLRLSAYEVYGETRINAPGHIVHQSPEGRGITISARQARRILAQNPGLNERQFLEIGAKMMRSEGYRE